jgi:hypothetical protein
MSLSITQPAAVQSYSFVDVAVMKDAGGNMSAVVHFNISDQNGVYLGVFPLSFSGAAFNTFWAAFNSGTFLYQELAAALSQSAPADGSLESEFQNAVS